MGKIILIVLLNCFYTALLAQSTGSVSGRVTCSQTNEILAGATVTLKGRAVVVVTNKDGYYELPKLDAGKVTLAITHVGYESFMLSAVVVAGNATTANISLSLINIAGNEIVVSASKHPQKITDAPASIQLIGQKELNLFAGSNVAELFSQVLGIEYTRSGVDDNTVNARGLHSAFNTKVAQWVDGRNTTGALSGGLPLFHNGSTANDDLERIEIVLGPSAALYGPNAQNILFNYITKDPRKYGGTTVSLTAGNQYQFSARLRHAEKINNKWAYKLSGEYATGKDYKWYDTVYAGGNAGPVINGFGKPVAIPERISDFTFRRYRGEGHVYYSVSPNADIIVSAGGSNFTRMQVTTGGHNQLRDVTYNFLQARYVHRRFFANIYNTWGNIGNSINIGSYTRDYWNRTNSIIPNGFPNGKLSPDEAEIFATRLGNRFKEKSQRTNGDLQYNYDFKAGLFLVAGLSFQHDRPNGYGITLIDSFERIRITQYGAVLQLEKTLPLGIRLTGAGRYDYHSNFGDFFSPKFAVLRKMGDGVLRVTWARAYNMPTIQQQYAGINRSLFGNGGKGIYHIPVGVNVFDTQFFKHTTPLLPEEINTWELGYKGTIGKKLSFDLNYYNGLSKNFISPTRSTKGRALTVNGIKVTHSSPSAGVVVNDTLRNASFNSFFNYGDVRIYGFDAGLRYSLNRYIFLGIKYSYINSDISEDNSKNDANKDGLVSLEEKSLNTPRHRAVFTIDLQNLCKQKLAVNFAARFVEQYDFYSGTQIGTKAGKGNKGEVPGPGGISYSKNFDWGPLGGFTTLDLSVRYKYNEMISLGMGITNLLNTRQVEFVGSPSIGRLISFNVRLHIPTLSPKKGNLPSGT